MSLVPPLPITSTEEMDAIKRRILARYQRDHQVDVYTAQQHWVELDRFLRIVASCRSEGGWAISSALDDLWHVFILHTVDYARYCELLGAGMLHHVPDDTPKPLTHDEVSRYSQQYWSTYGVLPDARIWAADIATTTCKCKGNSCFCVQTAA